MSFAISAVFMMFLVAGVLAFSISKRKPVADYSAFAQCLAQKDIAMYGAKWCSHCQNQKLKFGEAFKYVKYVECPDNIPLCTEKNIQGFPTWLFPDGKMLIGEQSFEKLAAESGCPLP